MPILIRKAGLKDTAGLTKVLRRDCSRLSLLNNRQRESYQRGFYAKNGWEERSDLVNFIKKLS